MKRKIKLCHETEWKFDYIDEIIRKLIGLFPKKEIIQNKKNNTK